MKKALIVGIDNYLHVPDLTGCVNDAHDVANVLARNADGSLNFDIKVMTATSESKRSLKIATPHHFSLFQKKSLTLARE